MFTTDMRFRACERDAAHDARRQRARSAPMLILLLRDVARTASATPLRHFRLRRLAIFILMIAADYYFADTLHCYA